MAIHPHSHIDKAIIASKSDVLKILHNPLQVLAHNAMVVSVVEYDE